MKKILLLLCMMSCMGCMAQKHLSFMGIPITGNITQFTTQLKSKGITVSPDNKKYNYPGQCLFTGTYQGVPSSIWVFYRQNTKKVYCTKVCLHGTPESCKQQMRQFGDEIKTKYVTDGPETARLADGTACDDYYISSVNGQTLGCISLAIEHQTGDTSGAWLSIFYTDKLNARFSDPM